MDDGIAIRTEGLTKRYRSGDSVLTIFADVSLAVPAGERVAIIGESGAGKSTLLHLLGGLDRPSGGRIWFGSNEISALPERTLAEFRNRHIGFVWQAHHLLPEFTAAENVMMPLLIRGVPRGEAARAAAERLEEVGLSQRATHRSGELSGGEQQRVVLARALVARPRVLLADEPTGNLDGRTGERVMDLLDELHRTHGLTTLLVTHNPGFAKRCDRILVMDSGISERPAAARAENVTDAGGGAPGGPPIDGSLQGRNHV